MKEYGFVESWTRIYIIQNKFDLWDPDTLQVIQPLEHGDILLYNDEDLLLYNPETKDHTVLAAHGIKSTFHPIIHNPSFASLKDVVRDSSNILNARSRN